MCPKLLLKSSGRRTKCNACLNLIGFERYTGPWFVRISTKKQDPSFSKDWSFQLMRSSSTRQLFLTIYRQILSNRTMLKVLARTTTEISFQDSTLKNSTIYFSSCNKHSLAEIHIHHKSEAVLRNTCTNRILVNKSTEHKIFEGATKLLTY